MLPPMRIAVAFAAIAAAISAAGCGGTGRPTAATGAAPAPFSPADTSGFARVRFARGTTSGLVNDSLRRGETRGYLLGADQSQVMMVHAITWPVRGGDSTPVTTVRVYSVAEERELTGPAGAGALWSGRLPATGDYAVRVSASGPTAYTLAVQIPRRLDPGGDDPTAAIAGTAPSRAPVDYIVAGKEGQTLAVAVQERDPVTLHVYGLDRGEQLAPLPERRQLWAGTLPATQDYVVSVVPADEGASYELTVTLR